MRQLKILCLEEWDIQVLLNAGKPAHHTMASLHSNGNEINYNCCNPMTSIKFVKTSWKLSFYIHSSTRNALYDDPEYE